MDKCAECPQQIECHDYMNGDAEAIAACKGKVEMSKCETCRHIKICAYYNKRFKVTYCNLYKPKPTRFDQAKQPTDEAVQRAVKKLLDWNIESTGGECDCEKCTALRLICDTALRQMTAEPCECSEILKYVREWCDFAIQHERSKRCKAFASHVIDAMDSILVAER